MTLKNLISKVKPYNISVTFLMGIYDTVTIQASRNGKIVKIVAGLGDLDDDDFMDYVIHRFIYKLASKILEVSEEATKNDGIKKRVDIEDGDVYDA